jgi:hypothetical protein
MGATDLQVFVVAGSGEASGSQIGLAVQAAEDGVGRIGPLDDGGRSV